MYLASKSKIKSITKKISDTSQPVYDIEVPVYDNFSLSNGLMVHNSKDLSDAIAAAIFRSISYKSLLAELNKREDSQILISVNKEPLGGSESSDWLTGGKRIYD